MKAMRAAGLMPLTKRPLPNRRAFSTAPFDQEAYLRRARSLLRPAHKTPIFDYMSATPSHLLNFSLAEHIPGEVHHPAEFRNLLPGGPIQTRPHFRAPISGKPLPLGHHLVYFGPQSFSSELMPDGTVSDHCPGEPFTRRMWAGGSVRFAKGADGKTEGGPTTLDGRLAVCVEEVVGDPVIKGVEGQEKVFVQISRKYSLKYSLPARARRSTDLEMGQMVREAEETPDIEERRTLVFIRDRDHEETRERGKEKERDMSRLKRLKDRSWVPTYSFSLTPDRRLLFHFSALTFNAHAIHMDPRYAQEVEGHKDCLVHGPLSLSLMLMAVRAQADKVEAEAGERVALAELNYRNLAPLYVGEEMKVCVRMREGAFPTEGREHTWDVWVEGPDGGFAVKGTAEMRFVSGSRGPESSD